VGGGRIASGLQMSEKDPSKWTLAAGSHPMIPKVSNFATRAEWQAGRQAGRLCEPRAASKEAAGRRPRQRAARASRGVARRMASAREERGPV